MPRAKVDPAPQPVININTQQNPPNVAQPEPELEAKPPEEKEPRQFMDRIHGIPLQDWGRIWSLELHRMEPKLPGVPGSKGYLCMYLEPITYAAIQQRYGGGKFRLNLCQNGKWKTSHDFDIEGQPIYDRNREVVPAANGNGNGAPSGDFQREFISVLREELQRSRESNQAPTAGTDHVVEMLTKASDRAMEIVTKQTPQQKDPADQVDKLLSAAEKLAALRGQGTAGAGLLDKLVEAALPLLLSALKPKTLAEQIAEAKALKDLLSGTTTDAEPADWRAMAVKMVTEHLPEILDALKAPATAAQARAAEAQARARAAETLRTVPANRAAQPAAAAQPQPAAPPAAARPATHIEVDGLKLEARDAAPRVEVMPAGQPAPMPTTQEQYDEGMKVQVVNMFRYGASGTSIAQFLEDVKPQMAKDMLNFPESVVTNMLAGDPILRLMVQDTERWNEVLAEAREYLSEEEETEAIPVN